MRGTVFGGNEEYLRKSRCRMKVNGIQKIAALQFAQELVLEGVGRWAATRSLRSEVNHVQI